MPFGLTQAIVVNSALEHIGVQKQIAAINDGSAEANAAGVVYNPLAQLLLREMDPAFARVTGVLTLTGQPPAPPWAYVYNYEAEFIRVRQIRPPPSGPGALADPFDPQAILYQIYFDPIQGVSIGTNQQNAWAVYTTANVTEVQWDAAFADAFIRRLANPLAMALAGRPEEAVQLLQSSAQMVKTADAVDEGRFRSFG